MLYIGSQARDSSIVITPKVIMPDMSKKQKPSFTVKSANKQSAMSAGNSGWAGEASSHVTPKNRAQTTLCFDTDVEIENMDMQFVAAENYSTGFFVTLGF